MKSLPLAVVAWLSGGALCIGVTTGEAAARTSPSLPGAGYRLGWENRSDWTVPDGPPPGWAAEYLPSVRHADGEPQVRVASIARHEPVRDGQRSVRFDLAKADPPLHNGSRAELGAEDPVEPPGVERWYGFSIYLPRTWVADRAPEVVAQWHQSGGECSAGCSPPLSIITQRGQWVISQNWQRSHAPGDWYFSDTAIGAYRTGHWTDWVVHVKWSVAGDGLLEIWKGGRPVSGFAHKLGRNDDYGERDAGRGNYFVIGIYKWPWSQGQTSDTTRRVLYTDALRIADARGSYKTVVPRPAHLRGHLTVIRALRISPAKRTRAKFTVINDGGKTIKVPYLVAAARNARNKNRDFPVKRGLRLRPGRRFTYRARRVLRRGTYKAWPAYYDGNNWRELGRHINFKVR
jgi:hypothetical protein